MSGNIEHIERKILSSSEYDDGEYEVDGLAYTLYEDGESHYSDVVLTATFKDSGNQYTMEGYKVIEYDRWCESNYTGVWE